MCILYSNYCIHYHLLLIFLIKLLFDCKHCKSIETCSFEHKIVKSALQPEFGQFFAVNCLTMQASSFGVFGLTLTFIIVHEAGLYLLPL